MGLKTEVKIDGVMVLTVVGVLAVGYVVYKAGDIVQGIKDGTAITKKTNWANRLAVHLLGVDDDGFGDLGSWYYCLTEKDERVCPKSRTTPTS